MVVVSTAWKTKGRSHSAGTQSTEQFKSCPVSRLWRKYSVWLSHIVHWSRRKAHLLEMRISCHATKTHTQLFPQVNILHSLLNPTIRFQFGETKKPPDLCLSLNPSLFEILECLHKYFCSSSFQLGLKGEVPDIFQGNLSMRFPDLMSRQV